MLSYYQNNKEGKRGLGRVRKRIKQNQNKKEILLNVEELGVSSLNQAGKPVRIICGGQQLYAF